MPAKNLSTIARLTSLTAMTALFCFADVLTLKDGSSVQGVYLGGDARHIRMDLGDHVQTFSLDDVANLQISPPAEQHYDRAPAPADSAPPPPPPQHDTSSGLRTDRTTPPSPGGVEIPSGTQMVVRMIDSVDSNRDRLGQSFQGSVDESVSVGEDVVIPRGANVTLKLVEADQSGHYEGKTKLSISLFQVEVNGRMLDVNSTSVTKASSSRGQQTAKTVGGGTALGAILGGIVGGGKGAAIGAVSGAGAGAAVEGLSNVQRVKIPAETRLKFSLQQPIAL